MSNNEVIRAFEILRERLMQMDESSKSELVDKTYSLNPWFTPDSVLAALDGIIKMLSSDLNEWLSNYTFNPSQKRVGAVMAGNIPAVGFHDLLCVLVSGNKLVAKLSEKDSSLISYFLDQLIDIEPRLKERIDIVDRLADLDAVIATGSDNTARYFEYYFKNYPHIIRKNRTSVAILNGEETTSDFQHLGRDIFLYFGLGCRNVSKLYVPLAYDFSTMLATYEQYDHIISHHKYRNNYDYNKSIYLVNKEPHLDNGVLLLKQDNNLVSPISVLFYNFYSSQEELQKLLKADEHKIQCFVSQGGFWEDSIPLGQAQSPGLTDYADRVDTMEFLAKL
ncbi:MAG: acyl-CoA reductase [Bacteroidota bacterium]